MKIIRTISAILLTFLVLVSSTSFMVGMHICMGEVQNISLFSKADGCEKEKALPPCHKHMKPACCEDETVLHEATDFKASIEHNHVVLPTPVDIEQPLILISEIIPTAEISRIEHSNYDPPWRSPDLTIALQVFLI